MRRSRAVLLLPFCLTLAACGPVKRKAAGYYVDKAAAVMEASSVRENDVEKAFGWLEKALKLDPSSERAVKTAEELSAAAARNGFARASELEVRVLTGLVKESPLQWHAYPPLVQALAMRGEMDTLASLAASLSRKEKELDSAGRHRALMAACLARAALLPWLSSDGSLALSASSARVRERALEYAAQAEHLASARAAVEGLEKKEPALRTGVPPALLSSFEVAMNDVFSRPEEMEKLRSIAALFAADAAYAKSADLTVKGNVHLLAREYGQARAMFTSALRTWPAMLDARRQLVEVDFQEGAGLAVAGSDMKQARRLLYRAYEDSEDLIEAALEKGPALPFVSPGRFAGDLYALKAAVISAVYAIEGRKLRNKVKLETEFKAALDEAVRLAPDSRLARELLERYSKEGF
ncbi:MAG TPA: hypothetical protein PKK31_01395 [Elusimicrobiales bacterium]|nr:hypothetical protein [Elusimicrobiales bacterium]